MIEIVGAGIFGSGALLMTVGTTSVGLFVLYGTLTASGIAVTIYGRKIGMPVGQPQVSFPIRVAVSILIVAVASTGCSDKPGTGPSSGSAATPSIGTESPSETPNSVGGGSSNQVQFRLVLLSSFFPEGNGLGLVPVELHDDFNSLDCAPGLRSSRSRPSDLPVAACGRDGHAYGLDQAVIVGGVESADAVQGPAEDSWVISVRLDPKAGGTLADISRDLVGSDTQLAIYLDGVVITAAGVEGVISDGRLHISGDFDEASARSIAASLARR